MKNVTVKQVVFDKKEKQDLDKLWRLVNVTKLPDNILYSSTFKKEHLKKLLLVIEKNTKKSNELSKLILRKLEEWKKDFLPYYL